MKKRWLLCLTLLASLPAWAEVQGAGATFPSKVYERWAQSYQQQGGTKVVYKPTGSGDGIKQATARSVQFGGTDSALPADELGKRKLVQIPMLVGGVVPVVHLPGVGDNRLQLDGALLGDIMAGRVARWNDARIAALNPGLALPALPIKRIVRADKSGTTDGFTRYLAQVSPTFKQEVGAGQLPKWPGEVEAADGNDGVAKTLKAREGGITYVSFDRVAHDRLHGVKLRNASGRFVAASEAGFRAAIADSELHRKGDDLASLLDRPAVDAWPITLTSFVLVDAEPAQAELVGPALRFLYWCFMHGDELTRGTGFAPLPVAVQTRLAARFATVKARDGKLLDYMVY